MKKLPKPYWQSSDGANRLFHGDCLEILPLLDDGSVDVCITDPPFGEQTHSGARTNDNRHREFPTQSNPIEFDSWNAQKLGALFFELTNRVCKRWVIATIEWQHALELEQLGILVRLGVWIKPNAMPQMTGDRPGTGWESVAICHRAGRKRWNGGGSPAVYSFGTSRWGYFGPSNHPTEKPLTLIAELIGQFSDPGETIIDPTCGSGTTGVAAIRTGRKCILIEKEEKYCAIAAKRLAEACCEGKGQFKFEPAMESLFA